MFLGERVGWNGKVYQLFRSKDGKEHNFSGIKRVYFGDVYEMIDEKLKIRPESVDGWEPTDKDRREYEAQKLVVTASRQANRKAMEIKRPHAEVVKAVDLLRPFYRALSHVDQRRFMEWIANECSKKKS